MKIIDNDDNDFGHLSEFKKQPKKGILAKNKRTSISRESRKSTSFNDHNLN